MNDLSFEWEDNKEQINIKKHGLKFSVAARVFLDSDRIEIYDEVHSITEDRYNTIGMVNDILFVAYTERIDRIRIISTRVATKQEKEVYNYGKY